MNTLQIILASIFGSAYFLGTIAVAIKAMRHGSLKSDYIRLYETCGDPQTRDFCLPLFQTHARMQRYCILIFVVLLIAPALVALNFAYLGA